MADASSIDTNGYPCAQETEAEDDGEPVTLSFLAQLTFLKVRTCRGCGHKSNELNPLQMGAFCNCQGRPTWPWLHGTPTNPSGRMCRLCEWALVMGGYAAQYGSVQAVLSALEDLGKYPTLQAEVQACVTVLIDKINTNQMPLKLRGKRKENFVQVLKDARDRAVTLYRKECVRAKTPHRAIEWDVFESRHKGEDLSKVKKEHVLLAGKGLTLCALIPKNKEGEHDVDFEASVELELREQLDTSTQGLRANQQEHVFNAMHSSISKAATKANESGEVWQDPIAVALSASGAAKGACAAASFSAGCSADEEESVSESEDEVVNASGAGRFDPASCSVLAGLVGMAAPASSCASTPQPTANRAPAKAKAAKATAHTSQAKRACGANRSVDVAEANEAPRKGKGKGSNIPVEPKALLEYEGFGDVLKGISSDIAKLTQGPLNSWDDTLPKDCASTCRSIVTPLQAHVNSLAVIDARISKRKHSPHAALDELRGARKCVKSAITLLLELPKRDPNFMKCSECYVDMAKGGYEIGAALIKKVWVGKALCLVVAKKDDELLSFVSESPGPTFDKLSTEQKATFMSSFLERVIATWFTTKMEEDDRVGRLIWVLGPLREALTTKQVLSDATCGDLDTLHVALNSTPEGDMSIDPDEQQEAFDKLVGMSKDASHSGVLAGSLHTPAFATLQEKISSWIAAKRKAGGATAQVVKLAQSLDRMKTSFTPWPLEQRAEQENVLKAAFDEIAGDSTNVKLLKAIKMYMTSREHFAGQILGKATKDVEQLLAMLISGKSPGGIQIEHVMLETWANLRNGIMGLVGCLVVLELSSSTLALKNNKDVLAAVEGFNSAYQTAKMLVNFVELILAYVKAWHTPYVDAKVLLDSAGEWGADAVVTKLPSSIQKSLVPFRVAYPASSSIDSMLEKLLQRMTILISSGMSAAIEEDYGAATDLLRQFESAYFEAMRMVPFSHRDIGKPMAYLSKLFVVGLNSEIFKVFSDDETLKMPIPVVDNNFAATRNALKELTVNPDTTKVALCSMLPEEQVNTYMPWLQAMSTLMEVKVDAEVERSTGVLSEHLDTLKPMVDGFTAMSAAPVAENVKATVAFAQAALTAALEKLQLLELDPKILPHAAELEELFAQAHKVTVAWAVRVLMEPPVIRDPARGSQLRLTLQALYDTNIKGKTAELEGVVSPKQLQEIEGVLAIKDSSSSAAAPDVLPKKKARKK